MKTYFTPVEKIERKWYVADADGKTLGRVAAEVAVLLRGKHKPSFCTFQDNRSESTRLNSSHQLISYAVFCLKKKKKK